MYSKTSQISHVQLGNPSCVGEEETGIDGYMSVRRVNENGVAVEAIMAMDTDDGYNRELSSFCPHTSMAC
jgi:hypothetical protein